MKINHHNAVAFVSHCHNLCLLAGIEPNFHEGCKLYEKLRRLELKASRINEGLCNGAIEPNDAEHKLDLIQDAIVHSILPRLDNFYFNGDPRGYALKMDSSSDFIRENNFHRDMGGYGILAPEF